MMFDGGWHAGEGLAMLAIWGVWLFLIGGIVALVVLAIRWFLRQERGDSGHASPGETAVVPAALDILRERYARGEIDDEEYERRRRILSGG